MMSFALFLALFLMPVFAAPARAQDEDLPEMMTYDPSYTGNANQAAEQIREMQRKSLGDKGYIKPTTVNISVVREPYMNADQFGLLMSVPDVVSGCYILTPLEYEAQFSEMGELRIKVKQYRRLAPEGVGAQGNCDPGNKMASALMVLDKKDLLKRGTKDIKFISGATTDTYRLILDETRMELLPQSMMMFRAQNMSGPLKDRILHSFASDKMVALQVPMAKPGEDLSEEVNRFAFARSLTPASDAMPVSWAGNGYASYYFYDNSGQTVARLGEKGYAELGRITVNRPYDGAEGRTEAPVELSVFVTRPGTQL